MNTPRATLDAAQVDRRAREAGKSARRVDLRLAHWSVGASIVALLLSACGGMAAPASKEPAPAGEEPAAEPAEETSAGAPPAGAERAAEQDAGMSDDESEDAAPATEASMDLDASSSEKKDKASDLMTDLAEYRNDLDDVLRPKTLSCNDAKPIVDAICSISERICNMDDPTSLNQPRDCKRAKKACDQAKQSYGDKCS
jgi:hypothetical protein